MNAPGIPIENISEDNCDFCGAIGATHEGGGTLPTGELLEGHFCDENCFGRWLKLKSMICQIKNTKKTQSQESEIKA